MNTLSRLTGPEFVPPGTIKNVVILLHGLGSNGDDLLGLVPAMAPALPNTAFLSPNAPWPTPHSHRGYQWFEYWDRTVFQIADDINHGSPLIVDFIKEASERFNVPLKNIILCGFSQGTMMSLYAGLRHIEGLGGIIGFSGMLLSPETLAMDKVQTLPPVLLVHGLQDTVVPAAASMQAQVVLKALGADVKYIQCPYLAHSIDNEGIQAAVKFCQKVFK